MPAIIRPAKNTIGITGFRIDQAEMFLRSMAVLFSGRSNALA
jgi:hypothetical protein